MLSCFCTLMIVLFVCAGQTDVTTVANAAFHDPSWFLTSELYPAMVTKQSDAGVTGKFGKEEFLDTLEHKNRHWVRCLPSLVPSTKFVVKPG